MMMQMNENETEKEKLARMAKRQMRFALTNLFGDRAIIKIRTLEAIERRVRMERVRELLAVKEPAVRSCTTCRTSSCRKRVVDVAMLAYAITVFCFMTWASASSDPPLGKLTTPAYQDKCA